ncbi:DUF6973 domain-containing protein [Neisseria chenwenguii]|uniref:DUF6973 domain-containing protein n=1 Tax=Neisseria chenwenguii TaxID=1853278 RepID=UPI0012FD0DB0|nr:hypothetical protein [Neisseria chenwenguii]
MAYYPYYNGSSFTRSAFNRANDFGGFDNKDFSNAHNDSYDAYRHALLSAKLTKYFGDDLAKTILDNHERDSPNPANETNMDKWNNNVGREEYHNWEKATESGQTSDSLEKWIYDKVKEGRKINDLDDPRKWTEPEERKWCTPED